MFGVGQEELPPHPRSASPQQGTGCCFPSRLSNRPGPQGSCVRTARTRTSPSAPSTLLLGASPRAERHGLPCKGCLSQGRKDRRLTQQIFSECLLCARHYSRHSFVQNRPSPCSPGADSQRLMVEGQNWPRPERQILGSHQGGNGASRGKVSEE